MLFDDVTINACAECDRDVHEGECNTQLRRYLVPCDHSLSLAHCCMLHFLQCRLSQNISKELYICSNESRARGSRWQRAAAERHVGQLLALPATAGLLDS